MRSGIKNTADTAGKMKEEKACDTLHTLGTHNTIPDIIL